MNNSHARERGGERDETRNKSRNPTGRDCGGGGRGGRGGGKEIEKCIVHRTWLRKEHKRRRRGIRFVRFFHLSSPSSRPKSTDENENKKTTDEEDDRREPSIRLCVCVCVVSFFFVIFVFLLFRRRSHRVASGLIRAAIVELRVANKTPTAIRIGIEKKMITMMMMRKTVGGGAGICVHLSSLGRLSFSGRGWRF